ncbi:MAG: EAL domain-containing protein [Gammaproteobacteria bacterium]|nr:EAL domain-containing protein [Gammaproteobacteria bacterium]
MIQLLCTPAITLLNRMGYTKKFTLLWLLSMVAIGVVVYNLFVSLDRVIQPSERELEGLLLVEPITRTIQAVQLHRGITMALLSGNEAMHERYMAQEKIAAASFSAMEEKLPTSLADSEDFRKIKTAWAQLHNQAPDWDRETAFAVHTSLIEALQIFEVSVADKYLLTLDPEIASFYLIDTVINKLPHAVEHLGQIRAYGSGILTERQISEQQRIKLSTLIAEFNTTLKRLRNNLDKTGHYNTNVKTSLHTTIDEISHSAQQIINLVKLDLLTGHLTTQPESFLLIATKEIDNSYTQMYDSLLPTIKLLINARIDNAKHTLRISTGLALLAFTLVVYLSASIYYATINSIHSLVRSARAFAEGNLNERARLDTRDELSVIADSFNAMAEGFNAMLNARKHAEAQLLKEAHKNETLLRAASDGIHILDLQGNVLQVNDAFCRMLGYSAEELATMSVADWDAQWTAAQISDKISQLGNEAVTIETRHRRRDGSILDVDVSVVKVDVDGQPLVYCSSRDVTERKQAVQALTESQQKLNTIIETALDAVVQMNTNGVITGWNNQAEKIFGWPREQVIGRPLGETIIPQPYREAHTKGLARFLASGKGDILNSRIEMLGLHHDGHEFPIELSITPVNVSGEYEFNGFIRDITRQKESERLIWKQANFDALTGLPNRHMFHDRLTQDIRKTQRTGLKTALLFIDLDKFKEVNDTLGHRVGDILLQEAAQRVSNCVRDTDTVARLGGDEFVVILAEIDDDDASTIERIAENILQHLARPFSLGNEIAYVSASIGITLHPVDATETEELLKNADQAMYAAKNEGRNRFSYFTRSMQLAAQERLRLTNKLHGALAAGQFTILYQPIIDLTTGRINKAEALIRWQHPKLGMVSPAQFIPLAEDTGLIIEIGDWVFREATRQVAHWRTLYNPDFQISINISPVQLSSIVDKYSHQSWFDYLQELELPGQSVVMEITEGMLLDTDNDVTSKLLEFRDANIQVAIDDFGTGYSSLAYLKKFDIDYLKIDQSFVRNLVTDPNDMALSEAIIVVAHKLGLNVIAEGVETEAQRQLLAEAGCDFAQGYLFSQPVSAEEFGELLKAETTDNLGS